MATMRTEALRLVGRCRKAGWPVEKTTDGWKVQPPKGGAVHVHLTASDKNQIERLERLFNRNGLAVAEAIADDAAARIREEKLAAGRREAEARTAKAAKTAAAVARAAGPYARSDVTLAEILAKHPAPITYARVGITPAMAAAMLERNTNNRKLRQADIDNHAAEMAAGRWRWTHQAIAFDRNGVLQDGQHRLHGVVKSGATVEMSVVCGADPANFAIVDVGRRRTAAQLFDLADIRGNVGTAILSAVTRIVWTYDTYGPDALDHQRDFISTTVLLDYGRSLDERCRDAAGTFGNRLRHSGTGLSVTAGMAAGYILYRAMLPDWTRLDEYLMALVKGHGDDSEPTYVIHKAFDRQRAGLSRKQTSPANVALIIKGWNAYVAGDRQQYYAVKDGSRMPIPVVPETAK